MPIQRITRATFEEVKTEYENAIRIRAEEVRKLKDTLGWSFREIGEHFGISKQQAQVIYESAKGRER